MLDRFISYFVDLREYELHRELSMMNCDMAEKACRLKNGYAGKTSHCTVSVVMITYHHRQEVQFAVIGPYLKCLSKLTGCKLKLEESVGSANMAYGITTSDSDVSVPDYAYSDQCVPDYAD